MLRTRAGFTLAEVLVALVLTAVIGAAVTGAFISQSRFFDQQEKVSFARGVSRGAMNMLMSELRMVERTGGVVSASNSHITVRVPYAMGVVCSKSGSLTLSRLPADPYMISSAGLSGYAWRGPGTTGSYNYVEGTIAQTAGSSALCTSASIGMVPSTAGGAVIALTPTTTDAQLIIGAPVFLYQIITYQFRSSTAVPGRIGLWRRTHNVPIGSGVPEWEEIVAPFAATAQFRFYVNDAATPQTAVPSPLTAITGIELTLDGLSERPEADGTYQTVPLRTAVFFRNR